MKTLKVFCSGLLAVIIIYSSCFGSLIVHFIDVSEGDSILIQMPNKKNILIDTGDLSAGYIVKKYLKTKNIFRLEYIIITHMHPDHVGGIFNILPQIKTSYIYYNGFHPKNNHFFSNC